MEASVQTALIASLSAIGGGSIAAFVQWRTTRSNQDFQLRQEAEKRRAEQGKETRLAVAQQVLVAHKLLSRIAREYSITTLDIVWNSQVSDTEYDKRYVANCEIADELRAIADLSIPDLSEPVDNIYSQMNLFWGYFRQLLRLTRAAAPQETRHQALSKVHEAARELGAHSIRAKEVLRRYASVGGEDG